MDRASPLVERSGRRYHIRTYGCQMNLADSERMAGVLEAGGYTCTTDAKEADVLVYNTCSIREKAESKVYSALGLQAKRKRQHIGDLKIVVAGCVAQQVPAPAWSTCARAPRLSSRCFWQTLWQARPAPRCPSGSPSQEGAPAVAYDGCRQHNTASAFHVVKVPMLSCSRIVRCARATWR